uniref:ATP synthase subunit a n=1 Tax=Argulus americanus TaxID=260819 RepID=Q6SL21_9CRUS|nr:ATP synthase F0 subunit 6 [Argulus americanus]AAS00852.1 ATP synthase F0 subunit 6 [Argulus americanus]
MMMSLFSIFDPSSSYYFHFFWFSIPIILFFLTPSFWLNPPQFFYSLILINKALFKEFKPLIMNSIAKSSMVLVCSLFIFILLSNLIGLLPYVFTSTSHMMISMSMAFPFWMSSFLYSWINHTKHALAHLTPLGTPPALMMFMVLIELISALIRPITLSIRLSANMIAGHLLISLITSCNISLFVMIPILSNILLMTLETAVAFIQAYVFSILITLYISEV